MKFMWMGFLITITFTTCKSGDVFIRNGVDFSRYSRIGVLTKPSADVSIADAQSISNEFVSIALGKKNYNVIERFATSEILKETQLSMAGLYEGNSDDIMKLKAVQSILLVSFPIYKVQVWRQGGGSVSVLGSGINESGRENAKTAVTVSVRIIAVDTGEMLYACTADREIMGNRLRDATKHVMDACLMPLPVISAK